MSEISFRTISSLRRASLGVGRFDLRDPIGLIEIQVEVMHESSVVLTWQIDLFTTSWITCWFLQLKLKNEIVACSLQIKSER